MAYTIVRTWKTVGVLLAAAGLCVMALLTFSSSAGLDAHHSLGEISRGDIERTISSTGTLGPVTKVEVGTQVSGIVDQVLVDFNDRAEELLTKGLFSRPATVRPGKRWPRASQRPAHS
jgi:multidrug efflux pump subunit AcrA (membrane-fusion protein)